MRAREWLLVPLGAIGLTVVATWPLALSIDSSAHDLQDPLLQA